MTTAARPTFDPAKGKDTKNPTQQTASRDQPSHTKLKYRKEGQDVDHNLDEDEFKEKLLNKELDYYRNKVHPNGYIEPKPKEGGLTHEQALLLELAESEANLQLLENQNEDNEKGEDEELDEAAVKAAIQNEIEEEEDDEDDDDDEEDTELLMIELEKIKKERAELKAKQEREAAEKAKEREQETLTGNPLLNTINEQGFNIKRRWDDDVIFKNQARGVDEKPAKRFINDMLRSDFHRKFMDKYMQ